jgi:hypothetical protein
VPRRFAALTVVVVAVALLGLLWWSPWDAGLPSGVRDDVGQAAEVPGVVDVEAQAWDEADGGLVSVTVHLDPDLAPDAAQQAADDAASALAPTGWGTPSAVHVTVVSGEPDDAGERPVELYSPDDGTVALAYRLLAAGAASVDDTTVTVPDPADLPVAADLVARADLFTPPATLRTADGTATYAAGLVPREATARLVADVAARPDVTSAVFTWNQASPSLLTVTATSAAAAQDLAAWLAAQDEASVVTPSEAEITVPDGEPVQVWVAGLEPPVVVPHTVPLPDGVEAWPADHDAPDCTGDDLEPTLSAPDAAAGQRYLSVLARNTSGRSCAVDGVPRLVFLDAADAPQDDVRVVAAADGVVPGRVVVPAGESVMSTLQWGAMSTANDPDVTVAVEVTTVTDADPVRLVPEIPPGLGTEAGPATLDVLDGAEVRVSPWVQASSGWSVP